VIGAGLAAGVLVATAYVRVDRDFAAFLPRGSDPVQRFVAHELRDSAAARVVLIRLGGADRATLAAASIALEAALARDPRFIAVNNGSLASGLRDLPAMRSARYVVDADAASRMTAPGLTASLARDLDALAGSEGVLVRRWLDDDPTGETMAMLDSLRASSRVRRESGVWFDTQGQGAMLVSATAAAASDPAAQLDAMAAIDATFARVRGASPMTIAYSGAALLAAQSESAIAADVARVSALGMLGVVAILFVAYRSARVVLLCAVPALCGVLAGVCATAAGFGTVHAITLAFGTTLLGEAVDYPSYLLTAYTPGATWSSVRGTARRAYALAVLTTAAGALAFLASGIAGLVEVGVLTAVGIAAAGAIAWWFVPRAVADDWRFRAGMPATVSGAGSRAVAGPLRAAVLGVVTLALLALARGHAFFVDDLARMNPVSPAAIANDRALRVASGTPEIGRFVLVRATDTEAALEIAERTTQALADARGAREIDGFDSVTRWLPSAATQSARRAALPDPATLSANLERATRDTPFRAEAFAPFLRDVEATRRGPPLTAASYAGTGIGLSIDALLGRDATGAWTMLPLTGVHDARALEARLARIGGDVRYVDLRAATTTLFEGVRRRTLAAIAGGLVVVLGILSVGLRSPAEALLVMIPAMLGATWSALLVVAFGGGLSVFHLIALLLVVGIGVNYALFVRAADSPRRAVRTLAVVGATTATAFAMMATSSLAVLRALGVTVLVGTIATLAICAIAFAGSRARLRP
jgi:predicted exporter